MSVIFLGDGSGSSRIGSWLPSHENGGMSTPFGNPGSFWSTRTAPTESSLDYLITDEQRERAANYLQDAYADGRLDHLEFTDRIGTVLSARTRRDLNSAFSGLARIPLHSQAVSGFPARRELAGVPSDGERIGGTLVHWSSLMPPYVLWSGLTYALSPKDGRIHREAAKALNTSVATGVALLIAQVIAFISGVHIPMALVAIAYFIFAVVAGIKAGKGEDWTNPIQRVLPLRVLDEGRKDQRRELPR